MAEFNINNENCIICLEDINDKSVFLNMPISTSTCKCIFKVHLECLKKNNFKCPICSNNIKDKIKISEIIGYQKICYDRRYKNDLCNKYIIINNKRFNINIIFYIFFSMILVFLLIFISIFYKRFPISEQLNN